MGAPPQSGCFPSPSSCSSPSSSLHVLPPNHNVLAFSNHCQSEGFGILSRTLGTINDNTVGSPQTELGISAGPSRLLLAKHCQVPQSLCVRQSAPQLSTAHSGDCLVHCERLQSYFSSIHSYRFAPSLGTCAKSMSDNCPLGSVSGAPGFP